MSHNLEDLYNEITIIKNNHLEHIKQDIDHLKENVTRIDSKLDKMVDKTDNKLDKMDNRLWWIFTVIVGGVLAAVLGGFAKLIGLL